MAWTPSKEFITELQRAPKPPLVIPAVPYPEEQGEYGGRRWYSTAVSRAIINDFTVNYMQFLSQMQEVIFAGREDASVRNLAGQIISGATTKREMARRIHRWVYENIEYKRTSIIVPPWKLIQPGVSGDCKSFTTLTGSLLGVVGIKCWVKLVKINGIDILHIYDLGSLTWEAVDPVGSQVFSEPKPISGYILYEVDRTPVWPPKPLPQPGEIPGISPEGEETIKKVALIGGALGVVGLGIWALTS